MVGEGRWRRTREEGEEEGEGGKDTIWDYDDIKEWTGSSSSGSSISRRNTQYQQQG